MGRGWDNARAAALRTQLSEEHLEFLRTIYRLEIAGKLATRSHLAPADRKQDRIRQKCSAAGVAVWRFGHWALTGQGIALLRAQGIEARSDETPKAAQPEGREPGGEADAPKGDGENVRLAPARSGE